MSEEVQEIDRALRRIARRQATLDVELLAWLRRAEEENIWPKLGYVHALEYLEEVFAFAPRTAIDRLRVANELGELPQIEKALAAGELAYGAVRELTRVATAETEGAWLAEARGKRLRDIERMVAGRRKGDGPEAKPDPDRIRHGLWLELDGASMAAWRQMRAMLDDELGEKLDDRMVVLEVARRCLAGEGSGIDAGHRCEIDADHRCGIDSREAGCRTVADCDDAHESDAPDALVAGGSASARRGAPRPMHMQHNIRCPDCRRGWQLGAGEAIEISASALAEIECDAVIVDDENGGRAAWTIPPSIRRTVIMRDHGRCQVPGCRAARFLAVHHIIHREDGGTNDEWNLIVLCWGHHKLHHDGILEISGRAPDCVRFIRNGVELLPAGRFIETLGDRRDARGAMPVRRASNQNVELARSALTTLGFSGPEARRAVETACAHGGTETLEGLIKEALRHCS